MSADGTPSRENERVQLNVTFRRGTLDELGEIFPTALEDSERVRLAVAQSIERGSAEAYMIRRT